MSAQGPSGFLLIHKPSGITSFDVIRRLRHILGIKKLGHSGVLDRPASGLLVVGANKATRLFELFSDFQKEYEADVWLGLNTATDDLTGELRQTYDASKVSADQFEQALAKFRGTFAQMPPDFSLAKKAGKEMYRYALAGEAVQVEARQVTVSDSKLLSFEQGIDPAEAIAGEDTAAAEGKLAPDVGKLPPLARARIWLQCSGGLYVRSLARDIGADLNCGGTMGRLVRIRVGPFELKDAHSLEQLEAEVNECVSVESLLQPLASIADQGARLELDATQIDMVGKGQIIRTSRDKLAAAKVVYGVNDAQELVCILERGEVTVDGLLELKPAKVFL
jgi:tRNA pseudouridine55 synthase